jgi:hypothetical protein
VEKLERLEEAMEQLGDELRDWLMQIKRFRDGTGSLCLIELETGLADAVDSADWAADRAMRINVGKHHLDIEELRSGGESEFWFTEWGPDAEHELSIVLARIKLSASRKRSEVHADKLAHISLHAAARWHERAADRSDEAFAASMRVMAAQYAEILAAPSASFGIDVAEGRWLGSVARITNQPTPERVLAVRTFVT